MLNKIHFLTKLHAFNLYKMKFSKQENKLFICKVFFQRNDYKQDVSKKLKIERI